MATILQSSTIQVDLANYGSGNPFTIGAKARIITAKGYGIYGNGSEAWTITNVGTVEADATFGIGVDLLAGGRVSNASPAALISGGRYGVYVRGGLGTVTNSGSILATGLQGTAIVEARGGAVSNLATGATIEGGLYGIALRGTGQVTNAGTIEGARGDGIYLAVGGRVTDQGHDALISGYNAGVYFAGASGTLTNAGTIRANAAAGIGVRFNEADGGLLINAGTIIGGASGMAVQFASGKDRLTIDPGPSSSGAWMAGREPTQFCWRVRRPSGRSQVSALNSPAFRRFWSIAARTGPWPARMFSGPASPSQLKGASSSTAP